MIEETEKASVDKYADVTLACCHKLFIGGDQLTVSQARNVKLNSASPSPRFDGLIPCVED